jgi:hypothetical protein
VTEIGQRSARGRGDFAASRVSVTVPPSGGSMIGSAVSVDRPGPSAESADGAAHHPGEPDPVTRPPAGQGSGVGADAPTASPHPTPTAPLPALGPEARGPVLALRVPAADRAPVELVRVAASAAAFSDAIGGGFLEEALDGTVDGGSYVVVLDEHRVAKGLRGNQRAAVLAARLGHVNRAWLADLRGDALVVGSGPGGTDTDVPGAVVEAAARSGLLGEDDRPGGGRAR